jgi:hypothetical protein
MEELTFFQYVMTHLDYVGMILCLGGFLKIGRNIAKDNEIKNIKGWIYYSIGSLIFVIWGVYIGHYGIAFANSLFFLAGISTIMLVKKGNK